MGIRRVYHCQDPGSMRQPWPIGLGCTSIYSPMSNTCLFIIDVVLATNDLTEVWMVWSLTRKENVGGGSDWTYESITLPHSGENRKHKNRDSQYCDHGVFWSHLGVSWSSFYQCQHVFQINSSPWIRIEIDNPVLHDLHHCNCDHYAMLHHKCWMTW